MKVLKNSTLNSISLKDVDANKKMKKGNIDSVKDFSKLDKSNIITLKGVELKFSKNAEILDKASKLMNNIVDVDMEKVEFYKKLLENGKYEIKNENIAKSLITILGEE